ncbi:hypothetical protein OIU74_016287 [Salix koriyanagi]|uniref:Uncharacterized protein n=1 Tax=Salix koriyanagi TaxID=2511006 RepID=A0A9Q0PGD5_9ROSI|nr:hypothetical protein OIU74_016287 [Salix koriyanagi]
MNYGNEDEDGRMANPNSFSQILTDAIDSRAMNYGNGDEDGRMANLNSFSQILTDAKRFKSNELGFEMKMRMRPWFQE